MHKIQTKLMIGMMIIIILTIASLWVYQVAFLEENYMKSQEASLNERIRIAGKMIENDVEGSFEEYAEDLYYSDNITLEVSAMNGDWLYTTGGMMGRGQMMGQRSIRGDFYNKIISNGEATMTSTNPRLNTDILVYAYVLPGESGILSGSIPLEPINETIEILQKQLLYLSIILIVLAMLISAFFANVFIKPISILNRSVGRIAEGELDTRVEIHTKDEFGTLADNFNNMAQNLSKVDRLRKDLVANVSHELRTPLGIIKGYAELTRDIQGELPDRRNINMNLIIEEVDRLSEVVDDILDFSQIQSGYMNLNKVSMSPKTLLLSAFDKYRIMAEEKNVTLSLDVYDETINVTADIQRIDQVLHNFIANALAHTESGGSVTIKGESVGEVSADRKVVISIIDTGAGIPEEALEHIWERYYKVSTDGAKRGTGLGLSIAKHILDAHGFRYGVASEVGVGSLFYFEMK